MLTLLAFAMVATFMFLIMTKRLSALIALILVPIAFALIGGFAAGLGPMMLDGIRTLAPTGVMLMFAILYFAIMIDSGLFDPAVRKILRLVKGDPLKVSLGTAALAMIVSLDGDGSTTYMICVAAVLPLYSRLGMSPLVMACLIMLSSGVLNMTPWGGPTARAASALHVDPADIFVPMIPAMIAGLLAIFAIAWIYGKRERARLGELHLPTDHEDLAEISVSQYPEARRPKLLWFNAILTVVLMATLIAGLLPMPVLFMIAFGIAMIVNYPCIQEQKKRIGAHAENILAVVSLIFAAGVFTGILSGTGMVDAMSKSLLAVIPPALGPYLATITALVSMPFTFFHVQRRLLLRRPADPHPGRRRIRHHPGGNGPRLDRRPAGAPAQPAGALHLPAGGAGQDRLRRPPALHPEMGRAGVPGNPRHGPAAGPVPPVQ